MNLIQRPHSLVIHASLDKVDLIKAAAKRLVSLGIEPLLPDLHRYQHIRDEFGDEASFSKIKNKLARENCLNVEKSDGVIVLNPSHRGLDGYVGGASFSQMVVGFYLQKPIFLTNEPSGSLPYSEEIRSFLPVFISESFDLWDEGTFG